MNTLYRINPKPYLEARAKGRTIRGISVPFDTPTRIMSPVEGDFWEVFNRGAFARTITANPEGFPFNILHDRRTRLPIGVSTVTREDATGLYQEFSVPDTAAGNEVLELAREGVPLGLSIGFAPRGDKWNDDKSWVWRTEVELRETSIVNEAAYADAKVVGVRGNLEMEHDDPATETHAGDTAGPVDDATAAPSDDPTPDDGPGSDPNSYEARQLEVAGVLARMERYR